MKKLTLMAGIVSIAMLSGCGNNKSASEVVGVHTPDSAYADLSCVDVKSEYLALEKFVLESGHAVDSKKNQQDNKDMLAVFLFLPALLFIDENDKEVAKYAKIKGKYEAVKRVFLKKCVK